jgi:GDP/UDP-N,N'-diacetylbacillosamine 2-epimerase (hydrolysing)
LSDDDSELSLSYAMGRASSGFGEAFNRQKPDMLIVLGDRYELLPICSVAVVMGIPIAHISGGEITEGLIDDVVRHSITKMSYLHFPGSEEYRRRIIQMGEEPSRVFNYGDIGVENIKKTKLMSKTQLEKELNIKLDNPYACVTFHPVTLEKGMAGVQIDNLLAVLKETRDMQFIITKANADVEGQLINEYIDKFVDTTTNCVTFNSVGVVRYLSLLKYSEMVIGNSSSGIIEAPCFGIPTVNIGNRQKGRLRSDSVIDCEPTVDSIRTAIRKARTKEFRNIARNAINPYGDGETSEMIVKEIKRYFINDNGIIKHFYDLQL